MCTSFYQDMLDVVTASWPAQCGSGDLANLAIAKGTQAVADVCSWQSNEAATVPVTGPYDVPSHSAIYQTPASLYATITSSSAYYYGITPAPSASFQSFASTNTRPYATPAQGVAEITRRPDSRELSGATVVGLAVGCTVLGLIMIAIPILVMIRKRKALLTNREQNSLAEEVYQDEKPRIETQTLPAYSKPPSYSEGKSKAV